MIEYCSRTITIDNKDSFVVDIAISDSIVISSISQNCYDYFKNWVCDVHSSYANKPFKSYKRKIQFQNYVIDGCFPMSVLSNNFICLSYDSILDSSLVRVDPVIRKKKLDKIVGSDN